MAAKRINNSIKCVLFIKGKAFVDGVLQGFLIKLQADFPFAGPRNEPTLFVVLAITFGAGETDPLKSALDHFPEFELGIKRGLVRGIFRK